MTKEQRKPEDSMAEETNKETIAGLDQEEEQKEETGTAREEEKESCAQEETDPSEEKENAGADAEEPAEEGSPENEDGTGEDVLDGSFKKVEEGTQKSSFFRKKKDKREEKIEELTDQVKRQMAEFDNFRKRTEKEKSQMFDLGAKSVIEKILPVIDNFERGLSQAADPDDPFADGMAKIYKSMLQELEAIGVKPIEAEGKEFDPNLHNAVMHVEDDSVGENIVVQELQKGYTYHDAVVRHSMVKVAN